MVAVRLIPEARVKGWEDTLRAAVLRALDQQLSHIALTLHSYGLHGALTAASKSAQGAALGGVVVPSVWSQSQWSQSLTTNLQPAADDVAEEAVSAAGGALPAGATWGAQTSQGLISSTIMSQALASGAAIGGRADAAGLAGGDVMGNVTNALASAADILGGVIGNLSGMAATMASDDVAQSVVGLNAPEYLSATKKWNNQGDDKVRDAHQEVDDVAINEMFQVGGEDLVGPGDPSGSDENVINCFPGDVLVEAPEIAAGYRRWYSGPMVKVKASGDHDLTGTPNHPILTTRGWVPLGELVEGDHLVCGSLGQGVKVGDPHITDGPTLLSQVFGSLAPAENVERHVGRPCDFHGDGLSSEVDVVRTDRVLGIHEQPSLTQEPPEVDLADTDQPVSPSIVLRPDDPSLDDSLGGVSGTTPSSMSRRNKPSPTFDTLAAHAHAVRFAAPTERHSTLDQSAVHGVAGDPIAEAESLFALASEVTLDEILHIEVVTFTGHVYNLQTATGWYIANGIVAHNCRCWVTYDGMVPEDVASQFQDETQQQGLERGGVFDRIMNASTELPPAAPWQDAAPTETVATEVAAAPNMTGAVTDALAAAAETPLAPEAFAAAYAPMTDAQANAALNYISAEYYEINTDLRAGGAADTPTVENLDRAMQPTPAPVSVNRTIDDLAALGIEDPSELSQLVGSVISDPAYLSTSLPGAPLYGVSQETGAATVTLQIDVPAGTPSVLMSNVQGNTLDEGELLLGRNTELAITSVEPGTEPDTWIVKATVLPS